MINLEEELLNSGKRHWINFKDPSGETDREMSFCVEDYLKYKKALEIIKNKLLVDCFSKEDNYSNYAMAIMMSGNETLKKNMMTEQEYGILKEVLS